MSKYWTVDSVRTVLSDASLVITDQKPTNDGYGIRIETECGRLVNVYRTGKINIQGSKKADTEALFGMRKPAAPKPAQTIGPEAKPVLHSATAPPADTACADIEKRLAQMGHAVVRKGVALQTASGAIVVITQGSQASVLQNSQGTVDSAVVDQIKEGLIQKTALPLSSSITPKLQGNRKPSRQAKSQRKQAGVDGIGDEDTPFSYDPVPDFCGT